MTDTVLIGRGDTISSIPQTDWEQEVNSAPEEISLFFLVRPCKEEVSWTFPVTVDNTGHHMDFSTGERLDAA